MPVFEIHYRIEEDGRVEIVADTEDEAREKFCALSLDELREQGLLDYDRSDIRCIEEV